MPLSHPDLIKAAIGSATDADLRLETANELAGSSGGAPDAVTLSREFPKSGRLYQIWNLDRDAAIANRVRLAMTSAERRQGLLGISELDSGEGLWISPCEAVHTFGMKIMIDIIFLDREHRVRKIQREVGPNRIAFCLLASSVVELAAGVAARAGTQVNDRLVFLAQPKPNSSLHSRQATSTA